MTKISPVLLWLLLNSFFGIGQATNRVNPVSPQSGLQPAYSGRQASFTYHRLAGQVVPAKKRPSERLSKGHPASLPCLTPPQRLRQPC